MVVVVAGGCGCGHDSEFLGLWVVEEMRLRKKIVKK